uniref:Uncharacterized protein MANES_14G098600 n=1 Tax=Rhizophora mucronata TaxID=61149 RepID=A0A2P2KW66_RHIMU
MRIKCDQRELSTGRRGLLASRVTTIKTPDDLFEVIGEDGRPEGPHGGGAFNSHDQLFLRHSYYFYCCGFGFLVDVGRKRRRSGMSSRVFKWKFI